MSTYLHKNKKKSYQTKRTHTQLTQSKTICLDQPKSRKQTPTVTKPFVVHASSNGAWVVPQEYIKGDATVLDGVYAVGDLSDDSSSSDEDDELRADAILDGGAADNMFGVPPECFDTYKKCNASWNTAKRGIRVQAKGQGRIIVRATSANGKNYLLQVEAYHVPELASNLLSVHYLCNRGYTVVHAIPISEIRVNDDVVFNCPLKGKL